MLARAAVVGLLTSVAFVAYPAPPVAAAFLANGSGAALATSQSIPASAPPVAVAGAREVTLSWSATTLTGGTAATSYTVRRYDTSNVAQTVLAGCDVVTTTSCVENNVPIGTWTYSVQARLGSWTGPEGSTSAPITVATSSFVLDSTAPILSLPSSVTGTIANFLVAETLTYRLDSTVGPVLSGTPSTVTSSTSMAVSVTVPAGTSDAPHSVFVVGSGGSFAAAAIDIVLPPLMQSMQMRDVNGNGKVDQVTVVFDDTLAAYTAGIASWTLTNVPSAGSLASVVVAGNIATLTITEGLGAANTSVGTFRVALSANPTGVRDVYGHPSSFAATAPTDSAAPAAPSSTMTDTNSNGKVDHVTMSFSEPLAAYTAGITPWTLANVPSGGALASVVVTSPAATITITEGAGATDTSVGSFTVALAASATGIRDAAGNQSSFTAAPADGAKPIRRLGEMFDDNVDGKVDRVLITFSETLAPFTAPATVFVLTSAPSGATLNSVTVSADQATLTLDQGTGTATTAVGSFRNSLTSNSGGIRDGAGNLSSFAAIAPADRAAPALLTLSLLDNVVVNGKVDRVTASFSEPLSTYTAATTPWTLANVPSGGTLSGVTLSSATLTLTITEGAGPADTTVGAMTVAMTSSAGGARDAAGNLSSFAARAPIDRAAPALLTLSLLDNDVDGKVDRVTASFSETLSNYTAGTTPWTLTNVNSGGTLASVSLASATLTLTLDEGTGVANTAVSTMRVAMATNPGGARDAAGNLSSFAARAPIDRAAPALVTLSLLDNNGNGKVDRVTAMFSETLQTYTAGSTPWTLTGVPSAGTLASVTRSTATLTLTLAEGGGAADTTVGTMTVAMAANSIGARDAIGNLGAFAATTPLDRAKPAAVTITDTNGTVNGDGTAQPGDTVVITFSEALAPGSVPSSTTVTLTDPVGTGYDTLTMVGVSSGARSLGANLYITGEGTVASFDNSTVTLSNGNRTITVTIAPICAGTGCGGLGQQTSNATYSYLGAPTLTDVAGNLAATAAKTQAIRLF